MKNSLRDWIYNSCLEYFAPTIVAEKTGKNILDFAREKAEHGVLGQVGIAMDYVSIVQLENYINGTD